MPFKTRPYLPWTIFIPNPFKEYEVSEKEIRISSLVQQDETIKLPADSVRSDRGLKQGLLHGIFNRGNVVVTVSGKEHTLHRIRHANEFMQAARNQHPDVLPPALPAPPLAPWHEGLTDNDLEDFEVVIPPIAHSMFSLIYQTKFSGRGNPSQESNEGWVRKGDIISRYSVSGDRRNLSESFIISVWHEVFQGPNTTNVIAPISGKISWGRYWNDGIIYDSAEEVYFAKIRPLKGERVPNNTTEQAYQGIITWCEGYLSKPEFLNSLQQTVIRPEKLAEDLEMIKRHKTIRRPIKPAEPAPASGANGPK